MKISWIRIMSGVMMLFAVFFFVKTNPKTYIKDMFFAIPIMNRLFTTNESMVTINDGFMLDNHIEPKTLIDELIKRTTGELKEIMGLENLEFIKVKEGEDIQSYRNSKKNLGILVVKTEDGAETLENIILNDATFSNIVIRANPSQENSIASFSLDVQELPKTRDIFAQIFAGNYADREAYKIHVKAALNRPTTTYTEKELTSLYSFITLKTSTLNFVNNVYTRINQHNFNFQGIGMGINISPVNNRSKLTVRDELLAMANHPLYAYSDIFIDYCLEGSLARYYTKNNLIYLSLFCFFSFFGYHLFREDFWSILRRELSDRGIDLNIKSITKLTIYNWRLAILPARTINLINTARKIAEQFFIARQCEEAHEAAKSTWRIIQERITDPGELGRLQKYYRIACGKNDAKNTLLQKQNALITLIGASLGKEESLDFIPVDIIETGSEKITKKSHKAALLETLGVMLPGHDFSSFSTNVLRNLVQAVDYLEHLEGKYLEAFLMLDLEKTLKESRLWNAIKAGERKIVKSELSAIEEKTEITEMKKKKDKEIFLSATKAIIIGGDRLISKQRELCDATLSLGVKECEFIDASKPRAIDTLVNAEGVLFISTLSLQHKQLYAMRTKKLRMITVRGGNTEIFKQEIIREYQKL